MLVNSISISIDTSCVYTGASITAAQLSALADIYHGYEADCADFVINLSSADFPVKTAKAIQMHLKNSTQHSFFDFFGKEGSSDSFHDGPDPDTNPKGNHMFVVPECWERPVSIRRTDMQHHHIQRRHLDLESWQMVISSQFWVLNRAATQHLVTSQHVQYLWHFLQHTPVTDESLIATAIHNDPALRASVRQGAFRYIGKRQAGRLVSDGDLLSLLSCKYLFARKFMSAAEALRLTNASRTQCT